MPVVVWMVRHPITAVEQHFETVRADRRGLQAASGDRLKKPFSFPMNFYFVVGF